jgi:hypothetical protein
MEFYSADIEMLMSRWNILSIAILGLFLLSNHISPEDDGEDEGHYGKGRPTDGNTKDATPARKASTRIRSTQTSTIPSRWCRPAESPHHTRRRKPGIKERVTTSRRSPEHCGPDTARFGSRRLRVVNWVDQKLVSASWS